MADVTIYTAAFCGYCVAAKRLLNNKGITYDEIDVTYDEDLRSEMVKRAEGRRTVPQIFVRENPIGGYTDLADLDGKGELDKLLAS